MIDPKYKAQVDLLLSIIPHVAKEETLALKGGTAINLFFRDLPRLSVDIDLTYIHFDGRETALASIEKSLNKIKTRLEASISGITVNSVAGSNGQDIKLNCQFHRAQVKIEVNTITRGIAYPIKLMHVTDKVQDEFGKFAAINVVSFQELFGGKICAALDRQHPRDLFDIHLLFENEGISEDTKYGFIIFLLSHMRPINEILYPNLIDQRQAFDQQFSGMTNISFSYEDYEATRIRLIEEIHKVLSEQDKTFLISFKSGDPLWNLFPNPGISKLPAIRWKLQNIKQLKEKNFRKHKVLLEALENKLLK